MKKYTDNFNLDVSGAKVMRILFLIEKKYFGRISHAYNQTDIHGKAIVCTYMTRLHIFTGNRYGSRAGKKELVRGTYMSRFPILLT